MQQFLTRRIWRDKMRSVNNRLFRPIAVCLVLWLILPVSEIGTAAAQQAVAEQPEAQAPSKQGPALEPGTGSIIAANVLPDTPEPVSSQVEPLAAGDSSSQSS